MASIHKRLEIDKEESLVSDTILTKRNEMAEKRAQDLLDTFLKAKQMRVGSFQFNIMTD